MGAAEALDQVEPVGTPLLLHQADGASKHQQQRPGLNVSDAIKGTKQHFERVDRRVGIVGHMSDHERGGRLLENE